MQTAAQISNLLRCDCSSSGDFDRIIREGFPWESVSYVKENLNLTDVELARILDVSERTLSRLRQTRKRLTTAASDRLYRLIHIFTFAGEVFEDNNAAKQWLHHPQIGLGGRIPIDFIRTEAGAREVEDLLGRIEYGVVS